MGWEKFDASAFPGVQEAEVRDWATPKYGFVREWMDYAAPLTQANTVYHLLIGLAALSVTVPPDVHLPDGDELKANFYAMVVGPSAEAKKTHAVEMIGRILRDVKPELYLPAALASGEGLVDHFIARPQQLVVVPEGGLFLAHTSRGEYGQKVRQLLTEVADGTPQQRTTVAKQKAKDNPIQLNPRVSMLMALTKSDLENFTLLHDWIAGYMSRYCIVWAQPERKLDKAGIDPKGKTRMKALLTGLTHVQNVGPCLGFDDAASRYFAGWYQNLPPKHIPPQASSVLDRAAMHARKAALLLAYDRHVYGYVSTPEVAMDATARLEQPWYVSLEDVQVACSLGTFHAASAWHLVMNVGENEDSRAFRRIRNVITERGGTIRKSELYRVLDQNTKKSDMLIQSLVGMHTLVEDIIPGNARFPDANLTLANPEVDLLALTEEQRRGAMN